MMLDSVFLHMKACRGSFFGLLACICWYVLCFDCAFAEQVSGTAKRPNVLFILVDDQSPWDLKIYNPKSPLDSPNLDRLAREGLVLDGAYHMGSFSGAVCTPSRHMIMSGRTVWTAARCGSLISVRCKHRIQFLQWRVRSSNSYNRSMMHLLWFRRLHRPMASKMHSCNS